MENTTLTFNSASSAQDLAKQANEVRLANKQRWYQITFENETSGNKTRLKCFNTWIQKAENPYFETSSDNTPTQFKINIEAGAINLLTNY
jgi:hypothetical protein